jgi:hypothetical protein
MLDLCCYCCCLETSCIRETIKQERVAESIRSTPDPGTTLGAVVGSPPLHTVRS